MNKKNKKYIILFVGIVILLIIFVVVVFSQQTARSQTDSQTRSNATAQQNDSNNNVPTISLAPLASTPKAATQQFYNYYFASSTDPLSNGNYKANPYLSPDFKDIIGKLYSNGDAPIFCTQNKSNTIVVGHEQTLYYNNDYLTQEVISDSLSGKQLYSVLLQNNNSHWQIFDVNCIY